MRRASRTPRPAAHALRLALAAALGLDDEAAWPVRFWDIDAGMAAMQLQLAAQSPR